MGYLVGDLDGTREGVVVGAAVGGTEGLREGEDEEGETVEGFTLVVSVENTDGLFVGEKTGPRFEGTAEGPVGAIVGE